MTTMGSPMCPDPVPPHHAGALRVRVPGSTSNLGPGFDCLGLALSIYLDVELHPVAGTGAELGPCSGTAECWPRGEDNLLLRSYRRGLELCGVDSPTGVCFHAHSEIPMSRGLGSSGAAVAAGLCLARAVAGKDPNAAPEDRLLEAALTMEGHPDNSTASLLGGCTLGVPLEDRLAVLQQPIHGSIGFAVAWPEAELSTAVARAALPEQVSHVDARENPRRLALLLEGLRSGDGTLLAQGLQERLHVAYRLPLIPSGVEALAAAVASGAYGATVSGAGSALIALGPVDHMDPIAAAMAEALGSGEHPAVSLVVEPVLGFPRVKTLEP